MSFAAGVETTLFLFSRVTIFSVAEPVATGRSAVGVTILWPTVLGGIS
jgi:hypothetical protein